MLEDFSVYALNLNQHIKIYPNNIKHKPEPPIPLIKHVWYIVWKVLLFLGFMVLSVAIFMLALKVSPLSAAVSLFPVFQLGRLCFVIIIE